jgi:hypothetical protein
MESNTAEYMPLVRDHTALDTLAIMEISHGTLANPCPMLNPSVILFPIC